MCAGIKPVEPIFQNDWSVNPEYSFLRLVTVQASGLRIYFGPRAAMISTGYGWPYSEEDVNKREPVVSAVISIARFFGSPCAIFLPDDIEPWLDVDRWISDGANIEDVRSRLAQIKAPSNGFRGAIKQSSDFWEVDGYSIEDLSCD